jgi:hypothetical protein
MKKQQLSKKETGTISMISAMIKKEEANYLEIKRLKKIIENLELKLKI